MIKDQCFACKFFDGTVCQNKGEKPIFDQKSCDIYQKGINLKKGSENHDNKKTVTTSENNIADDISTPVKQRIFSYPFSFSGRIRRLEYGLSIIIIYVYILLAGYLSFLLGLPDSFDLILFFPAYWFMWAQGAKRCHDRNNSGWYQIIPFYGLWMLFGDGDPNENDYGIDPKGRNLIS